MNTKSINITLEEAKMWYNGNNPELRKLALRAFSKKELESQITFEEICETLGICPYYFVDSTFTKKDKYALELRLYVKLKIVAMYLNKDWVPSSLDSKYFISSFNGEISWDAYRLYPNLVYFKSKEDAEKAYEILEKDFKQFLPYENI